MLKIRKILLPVDVPIASLNVIHQAATLAHHFHSELVMLHVATPQSLAAGGPENSAELSGRDLLAEVLKEARHHDDHNLEPTLAGLTIQRHMVKGNVAAEIAKMAQQENADLIMMPAHGFTFSQFLLDSSTEAVFPQTNCPVWTGAQHESSLVPEFAIRNVLCGIEFGPRNELTLSWAAHLAAEFDAHLTLANVTPGVEIWGPGGSTVDPRWKEELVSNASEQLAKLQQQAGIKADVFIGSGDVPTVLSQAVKQTSADLLVIGCYPYAGQLRTLGYGIMTAVQIPVLSV